MSYNPTKWEKGKVIDAESLTNIENGIHTALAAIESLTGYEYQYNNDGTIIAPNENTFNSVNISAPGNLTIGDSSNPSSHTTDLYTNTNNYGTFTVGTDTANKKTTLNGALDVTDTTSMYGDVYIGELNGAKPRFFAYGDTIIGSSSIQNGTTVRTDATINANTTINGFLRVAEINNGDSDDSVIVTSQFHVGQEGDTTPISTNLHGGLIVNGNMTFGVKKQNPNNILEYIVDDTAQFYADTTIEEGLFTVKGNSVFGVGTVDIQNNTTTYSNTAIFNANTTINGTLTAPTITGNTTINGTLVTNKIVHNGNFNHTTTTSNVGGNVEGATMTLPTGIFTGYFKTIQLGSEATLNSPDGTHIFSGSDSSTITLKGVKTNIDTKSTSISGSTTFGSTVTLDHDPESNKEAATKLYVDGQLTTALSTKASLSGATFSGMINFTAGINLSNGFFLTTNNNPYFALAAYQTKESFDTVDDNNYTYAGIISYDSTNKLLVLGQANRTYQTDIYGNEINFHFSNALEDIYYALPAPPTTTQGLYTLKLMRETLVNPETNLPLPTTNNLYWSEDEIELPPPPEQDGEYTLKLTRATENNITTNTFEWIAVPQGE